MTRTTLRTLVVALSLLLPFGDAAAQSRTAGRPPTVEAETREGSMQAEIFMSAFREIYRRHQGQYSDSTLWARALEGLVDGLDDPYASVFTPEDVAQFNEDNTGNYTGIGVQITQLNDVITVTAVFRRTPAEDVGMLVGDVIVGVNQHDATEWTTDMASDSIRGEPGTDVRVVVRRQGYRRPIDFDITRAEVHVPSVTGDVVDGTDIGLIQVDRFARGSAQEVDSVLRFLRADARAFILDLRRNPGGFLEESLLMSDVFLRPGSRLASLRSRAIGRPDETDEESWDARMPARVPDAPIVVLVDKYTASAAEIVAGALQDYDRALIVGDRTFGKGVVQSVLDLPYGHQLRITTGSWHTPLGRSLSRARDSAGRPLPEDLASLPTVTTAGGREVNGGGGIFPDVSIPDDTLTLREREFLQAAAEQQVNVALRVAEFGFQQAQRLRQAGASPGVDPAAFEAFLSRLVAEGIDESLVKDPEVSEYIEWRARLAVADRMADAGARARTAMERDPVLAEAVRLLGEARSQAQLFAAARSEGRPDRGPAGQR